MRKSVLFILLSILPFASMLAETVIYKSGVSLECKVLAQSPDSITIQIGKETRRVPKSEIFKVLFQPSEVEKQKEIQRAKAAQKRIEELAQAKKDEELKQLELKKLELQQLLELQSSLANLRTVSENQEAKSVAMLALENRMEDLETYVQYRPDWKEYYTAARTPWNLVWRSAVLPGWGHNYAEEDYLGSFYTTAFFTTLVAGVALNLSAHDKSNQRSTDMVNDFLIQPQLDGLLLQSSLSAADFQRVESLRFLQSYNSYNHSTKQINQMNSDSRLFLNWAIGIYAIQLIHSYITGRYWSKSSLDDGSKTGFHFNAGPSRVASFSTAGSGNRTEMRSDLSFQINW